jgi:hypothetical protein
MLERKECTFENPSDGEGKWEHVMLDFVYSISPRYDEYRCCACGATVFKKKEVSLADQGLLL